MEQKLFTELRTLYTNNKRNPYRDQDQDTDARPDRS